MICFDSTPRKKDYSFSERLHIDLPLLMSILIVVCFGLVVLYSASGKSLSVMYKQMLRITLAIFVMLLLAQLPPLAYKRLAPLLFFLGVTLLFLVLFFGETSKGAQRWLNLGFIRFQPSELIKLSVPLMVTSHIGARFLPPSLTTLLVSLTIILIPTILVARQPDLGTSILIATSGIFAIFLSGIRWKTILSTLVTLGGIIPILWFFAMQEYQKVRVRTLLNPDLDPLGAGYHITQSKIAIGSGGIFGKGWLHGTQSQLSFLPERHTDFIFAVISEEWGLIGVILLLSIYLFIIGRGLYLADRSQTAFGKMMGGSIILSFSFYIFVNIGMVSGILPVVGIPLPLISYGGTSMVTLMAGFGILMSFHTHRKAFSKAM